MPDIDIKQYEPELTYDKPITYIANHLQDIKKKISDEIIAIGKKDSKADQDIQYLNTLSKQWHILEQQKLSFCPVKVADYFNFFSVISCLLIEKNKIPDPKIISMSYLDYLFYLRAHQENGYLYIMMLNELLKLTCKIKEDDIRYKKDKKGHIILILNGIEYDKKDFDNIKKIICYQNMPDYDDRYIDPKFKEACEEAEKYKNKDLTNATLEDKIDCIVTSTSYKYEEVYDLTIRKFYRVLRRVGYKLNYQICKTAEMSGMVKFKSSIPDWMGNLSVEKYKDVLVDYNEFKGKISKVNN